MLEQVVARDPNYAPAWGMLGQAYAAIAPIDPLHLSMARPMSYAAFRQNRCKRRKPPRNRQFGSIPTTSMDIPRWHYARNYRGLVCSGGRFVQAGALARPREPRGSSSVQPDACARWAIEGFACDAPAPERAGAFRSVFNAATANVLWLNGRNDEAMAIFKEVCPEPPRSWPNFMHRWGVTAKPPIPCGGFLQGPFFREQCPFLRER